MQKSVLIMIMGMIILALSASGCLGGGDDEDTSSSDQSNDNSQLNTDNPDLSDSKNTNSKPNQQICTECGGNGVCWGCSGSGVDSEGLTCAVCGGNGVCPACSGTGMMATSQNG